MIDLLVDHNIERHGQLLWGQFRPADWGAMQVAAFRSLIECGLDPIADDRTIWKHCQANSLLLLTANRNERGSDSLQAVIREFNHADSLPVLTLADPDRVLRDAVYRELCAYRIADIALALDGVRGTGRLFIP